MIDNRKHAHLTILALRMSLEAESHAGWNTSLSFEPAVNTVINHLIELYGDPEPMPSGADEPPTLDEVTDRLLHDLD